MTAVQTSALPIEPDMFAGTPSAPPDVIEVVGTLIADAEVRTRLVGEHSVPVLCVEVRPLSGLQRSIHAELVYTETTRALAVNKAATLRRGARITVTTPLQDMRTVFPHAQSLTLTPSSSSS